jgi:alkylation response protein AidB-like acyl-CoA dehydrogenase
MGMYEEMNPDVQKDESISMLKKQLHEFAVKEMRPASIALDKMDAQEVVKEGSPYFDILKKMKKMGLHRIYTPSKYGGLGFTSKQAHVCLEELGWGSMGLAAGLGVDMVIPCLASLFDDVTGGSLQEWIDLIVKPWMEDEDAKYLGCIPFTEPEHGSDIIVSPHFSVDRLKEFGLRGTTRLDKEGDCWVINGAKAAWATGAPTCTHCFTGLNIKPHESVGDQTFGFIPLDLEGVIKGPALDKLGMRDCPQGELVFDNVKIPKDYIIVLPGIWMAVAGIMFAVLNNGMGCLFTGLARAAFEEALRYTKERVQGGKPLIEHETVLMRLANMSEKVETSRAYSREVLDYSFEKLFVEKSFDFPAANCYLCKAYCTTQAFEVANEAVLLQGTYGLTKDSLVEKLFRDARMGLTMDGCNHIVRFAAGVGISRDYLPG